MEPGKLLEKIKNSAKVSLGYYEMRKHKLWLDAECSELLDQMKRAKLQWLEDPSKINGDSHFKKKEGISEKQN
jgi:hypothetical protein